MKNLPTVFLSFGLSFLAAGAVATAVPSEFAMPQAGRTVRMDEGTPLIVTPLFDVSSASNHTGDPCQFRVLQRCRIDSVLLVEKNTIAYGRVEKSRHSKVFGQSGVLEVSFQSTTAVDGSYLKLRANLGNKGNMGYDTLTSVVKFLPLPYNAGMIFNGKDAILKGSVPLTIFLDEDADFVLLDGPKGVRPKRLASSRKSNRRPEARSTPRQSPQQGGTATP